MTRKDHCCKIVQFDDSQLGKLCELSFFPEKTPPAECVLLAGLRHPVIPSLLSVVPALHGKNPIQS